MRLSPVFSLTMALCMVSLFPSGLGLRIPHRWLRFRMDIVPEGLKQPPVGAESMAAEWPRSIGLRSPHAWVRFRMGVVPEGLKQPPVGAESMASVLPYPLGQLWDYLAQVDMTWLTWLLCRAWQTVWLLCMAWIALGLRRNVKRPQGQGKGWTDPSSTGTDCWGKGTCSHYELLCRMEANTTRLVRCLRHVHRLHLKKLQHQYFKKARVKEKSRAFSSSPCNSS